MDANNDLAEWFHQVWALRRPENPWGWYFYDWNKDQLPLPLEEQREPPVI